METFGERFRVWRESRGLSGKECAEYMGVSPQTVSSVENGRAGLSQDVLANLAMKGVDINWILTGTRFLSVDGHVIDGDQYNVAIHSPQKLSAGAGQQELDFPNEELIRRAPYPKKWGKGLICAEVVGDSMTKAGIFDGDLVYFRPGEMRGNGIYVVNLNGNVLVKRVEFDEIAGKLIIISENDSYQRRIESQDSQAVTIMGKVRGWMHEHPY